MPTIQPDQVSLILAGGPQSCKQLEERLKVSQPTVSRVLEGMGANVVPIHQKQATLYALRDARRGFGDIPIHLVDQEGHIERIGTLTPVRDEGYVIEDASGEFSHSEGLPWWIQDMRPQGFMGRAYAKSQAVKLGLPASLADWSDTHAVRALLAHGQDVTGNLLLGDMAREQFLDAPQRAPIPSMHRAQAYVMLSGATAVDYETWSPVCGEQPKFTAYAETQNGPQHVIVKFTVDAGSEDSQRWRDLLLCEHHALEALSTAGLPASKSEVLDAGNQRFLQVERFDRVGLRGRRGLVSLSAVDSEFAGLATKAWPDITQTLAADGHLTQEAHRNATMLFAYGSLIGNTDMHHGNLAFLKAKGRPYELAPAFDMLPMVFQPSTSERFVNSISPVALHPQVSADTWKSAMAIARSFLDRLYTERRLTEAFKPCLESLAAHHATMQARIDRLAY